MFTRPDNGVSRVKFYLDDPSMSSSPYNIQNYAPYEFTSNDTTQMTDGLHYLTAMIELDEGGNEVVTSTFFVSNEVDDSGNSAPVANAGSNQNVSTGSEVMLDGNGSNDSDGDSLTYSWSFVSKPSGSEAVLYDNDQVNPTFITDMNGTYMDILNFEDVKLN